MSLKPEPIGPVPQETARVAKAAFPKRSLFMHMRDELGVLSQDEAFAPFFHTMVNLPWPLGDLHSLPVCNLLRNYLIVKLPMP